MLKFELGIGKDRPISILCLGAHSDDIEIGCGGTILKIVEKYKNATFHWVVFSSDKDRKREAEMSARAFVSHAKLRSIMIENFQDGFFPYIGGEIKSYFENLKRAVIPDLVFTHYRLDLHQDHRLVSELTWNTFRDQMILEYEIPKYDGDLGAPNVFVHLEESISKRKIQHLIKNFTSQAINEWFTKETFMAILRLRGIESNSQSGYAEAFYNRKIVLL